jgi:serine/threonine-protein kinase
LASLLEGVIFAGRYRVVRLIAAGGMGEVYEVIHLETERRRALKVMHANILGSDDLRERFKREAKVAAHIDSEFIVDVFDAGVDDATGMPFLVMELLRGEELNKRLKRVGRFSPQEVVTYLKQTARALDKTHKASIVHRDLKPENLFLTEREDAPGTIKVLDFGIAKIVVEGMTGGATLTVGTPIYMAPEQFKTSAQVTPAADIFALGMVAYTLLVGASYWALEKKAGVYALTAVAMFGPQEPASVRAAARGVTLPPAFDAWFAIATATQPEHRFMSASEAVRALAEALGVVVPGRTPALSLLGLEEVGGLHGPDSRRALAAGPSAGGALGFAPGPAAASWSGPASGPSSAPSSGATPPSYTPASGATPPSYTPASGATPAGYTPAPSPALPSTPVPGSGPPYGSYGAPTLPTALTAAMTTPLPNKRSRDVILAGALFSGVSVFAIGLGIVLYATGDRGNASDTPASASTEAALSPPPPAVTAPAPAEPAPEVLLFEPAPASSDTKAAEPTAASSAAPSKEGSSASAKPTSTAKSRAPGTPPPLPKRRHTRD